MPEKAWLAQSEKEKAKERSYWCLLLECIAKAWEGIDTNFNISNLLLDIKKKKKSPLGLSSTGAGYLERLWILHPWKYSESDINAMSKLMQEQNPPNDFLRSPQTHLMMKVSNGDFRKLIYGTRCYHSGEILDGECNCDRPESTY